MLLLLLWMLMSANWAQASSIAWLIDNPGDNSPWILAGCNQIRPVSCKATGDTHGVLVANQFYPEASMAYGTKYECTGTEEECRLACVYDLNCAGYTGASAAWVLYTKGASQEVLGAQARCGTATVPCPGDDMVIFRFSPFLTSAAFFVMDLHGVRAIHADSGLDQTNGLVVLNVTTSETTLALQAITVGAYVSAPVLMDYRPIIWHADRSGGPLGAVAIALMVVLITLIIHSRWILDRWLEWRERKRQGPPPPLFLPDTTFIIKD
jgi:hypothetical protein